MAKATPLNWVLGVSHLNPFLTKFCADLNLLDTSNQDLIYHLYQLVEEIEEVEEVVETFPSIFSFIESNGQQDLGSPGPLVHFLEAHDPKHRPMLIDSLKRNPVQLTVWMLNRIINAESNPLEKAAYLELMESISISDKVEAVTREQAKGYYENQLHNDA